MTKTPWEKKADEVIAELCYAAYLEANTTKAGKRRKRYKPYAVPDLAENLVAALGMPSEQEREREVKALLLYHNYLKMVDGRDLL